MAGAEGQERDVPAAGAPAELVALGEVLGGYRLQAALGRGSTSQVFLGVHTQLGRRAAVKVLSPELTHEPTLVERLFREARVVNDIQHANIVDVTDFVDQPSPRRVALIMELVSGPSLAAGRGRPMRFPQAMGVAIQLVTTMRAAHMAGVIHRDLKPENLLLTLDPWQEPELIPTLKIVDFGLAKLLGSVSNRAATRVLLGTPTYMAPEQISGRPAPSPATDVYAVGELLFELLTGERVYLPTSPAEVIRAKLRGEVRALALPSELAAQADLLSVIRRCLARSPSERPSLAEVQDILLVASPRHVLQVGASTWARGLVRSSDELPAQDPTEPSPVVSDPATVVPPGPAFRPPAVDHSETAANPLPPQVTLREAPPEALTQVAPRDHHEAEASEAPTPADEHLPTAVEGAAPEEALPTVGAAPTAVVLPLGEPTAVHGPGTVTAPMAPRPTRRRRPVAVWVAGALVAGALGAVWAVTRSHRAAGPTVTPPEPVAAPAAQPRPVVTGSPVQVRLASEPAGATVRRKTDGAPLGRTPLDVTLAPHEDAVDVVVEAPEHSPQVVTVRRDSPPTSVRLVSTPRRRAPAPPPAAANTGPLDDKDLGSW